MPVSQFTIYSSQDAGAPQLSGTAGSILTVLDACLVNGYGSKTAAGWTKPIANASNCGHYLQGTGSSGHYLYINDDAPNATVSITYTEAWATGWKTMSALTKPVGVGTSQFPTPAQLLTTGHTVIKKSDAISSAIRNWVVIADASTFYLLTQADSTNTGWYHFWFGDFFSVSSTTDEGRCLINGRIQETAGAANTYSYDTVDAFIATTAGTPVTYSARGLYASGPGGGMLVSSPMLLSSFWGYAPYASTVARPFAGAFTCPNPADQSILIAPIRVHDNSNGAIRGRARGLWCPGHPHTNFHEGQIIQGANDASGRTFQAFKSARGGTSLFEISNTVETN